MKFTSKLLAERQKLCLRLLTVLQATWCSLHHGRWQSQSFLLGLEHHRLTLEGRAFVLQLCLATCSSSSKVLQHLFHLWNNSSSHCLEILITSSAILFGENQILGRTCFFLQQQFACRPHRNVVQHQVVQVRQIFAHRWVTSIVSFANKIRGWSCQAFQGSSANWEHLVWLPLSWQQKPGRSVAPTG